MQEAAAAALSVLTSGSQESCDAIIAAGAVPVLVTLSRSDSWFVQDIAEGTLANLARGSQQKQDAIIATDAINQQIACGCHNVELIPVRNARDSSTCLV